MGRKTDLKRKKGYTGDPSLIDTHRDPLPKAKGGGYDDENYRLLHPVEHMEIHGIKRVRPEWMKYLKQAIDILEQHLKLRIKISNQLLAFKRETDDLDPQDIEVLEKILKKISKKEKEAEKEIEKRLMKVKHNDPIIDATMCVRSLGPGTAAYLAVYINVEKADHPSSLWQYVGYDKPSHSRYEKGKAGGGNKKLRTALYRSAISIIKSRSPYRDIYDQRKEKTSKSELVVKTRLNNGLLVEKAWKDTMKGHRHDDAIRVMMKRFLCHYWIVARKLKGLPVSEPYVQEHLGHIDIDKPEDYGWPQVEPTVKVA